MTAHRQTEEPQNRNMVPKAGRGNCYSMGSIEEAVIAWEIMASTWENTRRRKSGCAAKDRNAVHSEKKKETMR